MRVRPAEENGGCFLQASNLASPHPRLGPKLLAPCCYGADRQESSKHGAGNMDPGVVVVVGEWMDVNGREVAAA